MRDLERDKLFEAMAFFLENTKYPGLVKLFKLLYYLDMLHFRETGRSVTGLQYTALPYGPVPAHLYDEVKRPPPDLLEQFSFTRLPAEDIESLKPPVTIIKAKRVKTGYLTNREERIAKLVAEIFRDATGEQISDVSHAKNGPWDLAKKRGQGKWSEVINYLDSVNLEMGAGRVLPKELLKARAAEFDEAQRLR